MLQFGKKKPDAGNLGTGSSERKNLMLGSLVLVVNCNIDQKGR